MLGSPKGPLVVCGHKFKVRPDSTLMYSTLLGFSVEIHFFIEFKGRKEGRKETYHLSFGVISKENKIF